MSNRILIFSDSGAMLSCNAQVRIAKLYKSDIECQVCKIFCLFDNVYITAKQFRGDENSGMVAEIA